MIGRCCGSSSANNDILDKRDEYNNKRLKRPTGKPIEKMNIMNEDADYESQAGKSVFGGSMNSKNTYKQSQSSTSTLNSQYVNQMKRQFIGSQVLKQINSEKSLSLWTKSDTKQVLKTQQEYT